MNIISNYSSIYIYFYIDWLLDFPLFDVENSCLIIGEENMKGTIKLDGNKDEVFSNSNLIMLTLKINNIFYYAV